MRQTYGPMHVCLLLLFIYDFSKEGEVAGSCECGNEPSGSIKCGEFLD